MNKTPTTLIIMDGFGLAPARPTATPSVWPTRPVLDRLFAEYAHTTLSASGLDVGLPDGQMGNSEVGHTNIGGGRVVFQDLPRISRAIEDGSFFENEAYNEAMDDCLEKGTSSAPDAVCCPTAASTPTSATCIALLQMAKRQGAGPRCMSTASWTDGTCPPPAARALWQAARRTSAGQLGIGKIATVMGRYYAMDRDKRWERRTAGL